MSINDRELLNSTAKGANIYPGVANPTPASGTTDPITSNFVDDPTTDTMGAGAGSNFQGHREAQRSMNKGAGVVEHHPGLIESTNIDPLNQNSNKDDGWANASTTSERPAQAAQGYLSSAAQVVTGGAQLAYGHVTGDEQSKKTGSQNVWGESA